MSTALKLENISKWFGKRKVIDNISFEVNSGEVFGFLGPNGAGKTTTIKMIMGFLNIDEGKVFINGVNLKKDYENAMESIGGIVENPEMYNYLSGLTNLKMYARLHKGVTKERINEVVELVGMTNRIKDKVKKYSLGMKQRICLAQSLLHKPKLLILDEPTNGLDPAGIKELRDILKSLAHNEDVAVFVSSHLLSEMELMCDKVGIINNGKLLGVMTVQELIDKVSGSSAYRFNVKPADQAAVLLKQNFSDKIKYIGSDYIDLSINEEEVPQVSAYLVSNNIGIFGVSKVEVSFEDAFISITGGGNNIA